MQEIMLFFLYCIYINKHSFFGRIWEGMYYKGYVRQDELRGGFLFIDTCVYKCMSIYTLQCIVVHICMHVCMYV